MIDFLNKLFGRDDDSNGKETDTETVRRIAAELDRMDPDEARYLAAFAFVLARVANSDSHISDEETRRMEAIVRSTGGGGEPSAIDFDHGVLIGGLARLKTKRYTNTHFEARVRGVGRNGL